MNYSSSSPVDTWRQVTEALVSRASDPDFPLDGLTASQRSYLRITKPIAIVQGHAVLATPNQIAKRVIENDLGEAISLVWEELTGAPIHLAVSVDTSLVEDSLPPTSIPEPDTPEQNPYAPASKPAAQPTTFNPATPSYPATAQTPTAQTPTAQTPTPSQPPTTTAQSTAKTQPQARSLNPKHTFDSFVTGKSNAFSRAAAFAVAESPAEAYNPLYIWGGSGLGKTHLLHATGNYALQLNPSIRVMYVSSEEFTNDYINSVRDDRQESFKRRYRNLDILMVDDIQFLEGKEGTQEEFFHTFNALHQANKQILLSSDRPPNKLVTLEDRLRTRFQAGLITDIQPPDLETRIAILEKKAIAEHVTIDRASLTEIATPFPGSIRSLEGALIRVTAFASLTHRLITPDLVREALSDLVGAEQNVDITPADILQETARFFNIPISQLKGSTKTRPVSHARQLAMFLCREFTSLSLPKIGAEFGKDHTTVMYADRKIRKEMSKNRDTYNEVQQLAQKIKQAAAQHPQQ